MDCLSQNCAVHSDPACGMALSFAIRTEAGFLRLDRPERAYGGEMSFLWPEKTIRNDNLVYNRLENRTAICYNKKQPDTMVSLKRADLYHTFQTSGPDL